MRILQTLCFRVLPALIICFSVIPARADIALPPGLLEPYVKGARPEVSCRRDGTSLILTFHAPGPCAYSLALTGHGGKSLLGPKKGVLERFGRQSVSVRIDLPVLSAGNGAESRFTVSGNLYTYKKVPLVRDDDEGFLAAFGRNLRVRTGFADEHEFRYELQDRNGKRFSLDVPLVIKDTKDGDYAVSFDGKSLH
ncbi:MAG: hypothetical protein K5657_00530 [Desulfovibrio sp.]|nr:hypothetical protein [Desulfovibrio sp.]